MARLDIRMIPAMVLLCLMAAVSGKVSAAAIGVHAGGSITSPCSPLGASGFSCGPDIVNLDEDYDNGVDATSADISVSSSGSTGESHISFAADGSPVFTMAATAGTNRNVSVHAEAARKFVYTGVDAFELIMTGNFHAFLNGQGTAMQGRIALIPEEDLDILIDDVFGIGKFGGNLSGYFFEGVFPIDTDLDSENQDGEFDLTMSVSTTVNNGDVFWLWGRFGGYATNGGTFNALNTGTFAFNTTDIQAVAVIPVPAALWLFASGLGLLGVTLRRRG